MSFTFDPWIKRILKSNGGRLIVSLPSSLEKKVEKKTGYLLCLVCHFVLFHVTYILFHEEIVSSNGMTWQIEKTWETMYPAIVKDNGRTHLISCHFIPFCISVNRTHTYTNTHTRTHTQACAHTHTHATERERERSVEICCIMTCYVTRKMWRIVWCYFVECMTYFGGMHDKIWDTSRHCIHQLSLSHTRTHTFSLNTHACTHSHTRTLSLSLSLSLTHTHTQTHTHIHTHTHRSKLGHYPWKQS